METCKSEDLHGNVPDVARAALLLVDVLNDFAFPQNEYLLSQLGRLAESITELKRRCVLARIPCIYANDNRGRWRSNVCEVLRDVSRDDAPGQTFVEKLTPGPDDYVVLKPKHSAFFATPLEAILQHMGVKSLIVAGVTANACVLVSVGDAYVRGYQLFVPQDCVASLTPQGHAEALHLMQESFGVDARAASQLDLQMITQASKEKQQSG